MMGLFLNHIGIKSTFQMVQSINTIALWSKLSKIGLTHTKTHKQRLNLKMKLSKKLFNQRKNLKWRKNLLLRLWNCLLNVNQTTCKLSLTKLIGEVNLSKSKANFVKSILIRKGSWLKTNNLISTLILSNRSEKNKRLKMILLKK
jgi:hypothetical protein